MLSACAVDGEHLAHLRCDCVTGHGVRCLLARSATFMESERLLNVQTVCRNRDALPENKASKHLQVFSSACCISACSETSLHAGECLSAPALVSVRSRATAARSCPYIEYNHVLKHIFPTFGGQYACSVGAGGTRARRCMLSRDSTGGTDVRQQRPYAPRERMEAVSWQRSGC